MDIPQNPSPAELLLTLTRKMLASAEASDWDKLAELEKIRLPLFHHVFADGISSNVELAQKVLSLDEKTKNLAVAGLPILQQEILAMRDSGKAHAAYQVVQDISSGHK